MGDRKKSEPKEGRRLPSAPPPADEFTPAGGPEDDPLTRNLKLVYQDVLAEPIPREWINLLNQLDAKTRGPKQ
jgi:Anti-sigma factor NepR